MSGVYGYLNDPTLSTGTVGTGGGAGGTNVGENETSVAALNNGIRGLAGDIAMHRNDTGGKLTTAGAANAYTVALESLPTALADGMMFSAIVHATNTGASTITPNSGVLAAKAILYKAAALSGGELVAGQVYRFSYDSSAASGSGAWLLENPSPVASALPSYTSNDIGNDSTANGGAGTVTDALNEADSRLDALVAGVSTSFDTLAKVETKFGQVDTSLANKLEASDIADKLDRTSANGAAVVPRGTTAQRPASNAAAGLGWIRYNDDDGGWEGNNGTEWSPLGGGSNPDDLTETVLLNNVRISAADYTITGIPADAVMLDVLLEDFSSNLSGTFQFRAQLGDAGGIETTGYHNGMVGLGDNAIDPDPEVSPNVGDSSILLGQIDGAADSIDARFFLQKVGPNMWLYHVAGGRPFAGNERFFIGFGHKTLSAALSQIFLDVTGNFDGGSDLTVRYWS